MRRKLLVRAFRRNHDENIGGVRQANEGRDRLAAQHLEKTRYAESLRRLVQQASGAQRRKPHVLGEAFRFYRPPFISNEPELTSMSKAADSANRLVFDEHALENYAQEIGQFRHELDGLAIDRSWIKTDDDSAK
jgi:hypothetical protein